MTSSSQSLLDLAARVEDAEGVDRLLDALIAAIARVGAEDWPWAAGYPAWEASPDGRVHLEKNGPSFEAPAYTASIDSAMMLVPSPRIEGEYVSIGVWTGPGVHAPHVRARAWVSGSERVLAATPALALCAAALRARAQEQSA